MTDAGRRWGRRIALMSGGLWLVMLFFVMWCPGSGGARALAHGAGTLATGLVWGVAAVALTGSGAVLARLILQSGRERPSLRLGAGALVAWWPGSRLAGLLLEGTRLGDPARDRLAFTMGIGLALAASALAWLWHDATDPDERRRPHRWRGVGLLLAALTCLLINGRVLVAQYALWHAVVAVAAVAAAVPGILELLSHRARRRVAFAMPVLAVAVVWAPWSPPSGWGRSATPARLTLLVERLAAPLREPSAVGPPDLAVLDGRFGDGVSGRRDDLVRALGGVEPRDVILITIDTLRADGVGFLGSQRDTTPFLDGLARESVVFERAYAQGSASLESILSVFTGRYPGALNLFRGRAGRAPVAELTLAEALADAGRRTVGIPAYDPPLLASSFREFGRGFTDWRVPPGARGPDAREVVRQGLDALSRPDERPVFLWLHFLDVHGPYPSGPSRFGATPRDLYDGATHAVDAVLREFWASASAAGRLDRALVVVHSDHGEEFGEHGGRYHGTTLYEEVIHVPLLVWLPGLPARRVAKPVELVDLAPTVFDVLGIEAPVALHGDSLVPELLGSERDRPVVAQVYSDSLLGTDLIGVVEGHQKIVRDRRTGLDEVFDLVRDPKEQHPQATDLDEGSRRRLQALVSAASVVAETPPVRDVPLALAAGPVTVPPAYGDDAFLRRALRGEVSADPLRLVEVVFTRGAKAYAEELAGVVGSPSTERSLLAAVAARLARGEAPGLHRTVRDALLIETDGERRGLLLEALAGLPGNGDWAWLHAWAEGQSPAVRSRAMVVAAAAGDGDAEREVRRLIGDWSGVDFYRALPALARRVPWARATLIGSVLVEAPDPLVCRFVLQALRDLRDEASLALFAHLRHQPATGLAELDDVAVATLGPLSERDPAALTLYRIYLTSTRERRLSALAWLGRDGNAGSVLDRLDRLDRAAGPEWPATVELRRRPASSAYGRRDDRAPLLALAFDWIGDPAPVAERPHAVCVRSADRTAAGWLLVLGRLAWVGAALEPVQGEPVEIEQSGRIIYRGTW